MILFLAANWLRIVAAFILLSLLVWILVSDYRFKHERRDDDADLRPKEWWGA